MRYSKRLSPECLKKSGDGEYKGVETKVPAGGVGGPRTDEKAIFNNYEKKSRGNPIQDKD